MKRLLCTLLVLFLFCIGALPIDLKVQGCTRRINDWRGWWESNMTITHIGTNDASNTGGGAITFTTPTGTASGDILIAVISDDHYNEDWTKTGWTVLDYIFDASPSSRLTVLYHVLTAAPDATYIFDADSTSYRAGTLSTFRKTAGTWDFVDQSGNDYTENDIASNVNLSMTSTDSASGGMLITAWGCDGGESVSNAPGTQI